MNIKLHKDLASSLLMILFINFMLEFYYVSFVIEVFEYMGFFLDFSILKYAESKLWLLIFLITIIILYYKSKFIYALYVFLGLLIFIPASIIFAYSNGLRLPLYSIILFFTFIFILSPIRYKIKVIKLKESNQYYILIISLIIFLIPLIKDIGFAIYPKVLILKDIYEVRNIFSSHISPISSYFFWWLGRTIIPVMIIISLLRRNTLLGLFSISVLLYLFVISGHKSIYFTFFIVIFYYYIGKDIFQKVRISLTLLVIFLILINIPDYFLDTILFKSIFIRRLFFIPALLTQYYFDYFQNKPLFLSHSIFSTFIDYPYDLSPVHLIADKYFNKPQMAANNGVISDGYMNFGFFGVFLYAFLFSAILAFFNSLNINQKYFGIFVYFMMIFNSSAFLTIILTHGLWLIIIFAYLIFPNKKHK